MSAIEHCRTAALGGHVEACEDCGQWRIAYNSCRNRHCPKCQGAAARTWLAEREADLLPVGYFHVVFTLPAEVADIAFHNKALVYDLLFKAASETMLTIAADREASRRTHRHHRRAPHLGFGDDAPSARAHDRAGRRHRAGRKPLDIVAPGLPASGAGARQAVPPALPHPAGRAARRRPARLLRIDGAPRRPAGIPAPPARRPEEALGGLRQGAVRRAGGGARLSVALHPPGRDLEQPPDRASTRAASPSATRTIAATAPTGSRS